MARKTLKRTTTSTPSPLPGMLRRIAWMLLAGGWLFGVASLVGYDPADWPTHAVAPVNWPVHNPCGPAGAWLAYQSYLTIGPGVWLMLAGALALLVTTARGKTVSQLSLRIIGTAVCAVALGGFVALRAPHSGFMPEGSGGLLAIWLVEQLITRFSTLGTSLVLVAIFGVGAIVAVDELVSAIPKWIGAFFGRLARVNWPRPVLVGLPSRMMARWRNRDESGTLLRPRPAGGIKIRHPGSDDADVEIIGAGVSEEESYETDEPDDEQQDIDAEHEVVDEDEDADYEDDEETAGEPPAPARPPLDEQALREKIKKLPITFAQPAKPAPPPPPRQQDFSGYKFPGLDLLAEPEHHFNDEMAKLVRDQAEVLERAMQTYRIAGEVVAIDAGPVITLYEVALAPGTKVAQVNNIASDLARELKAQNIRVVPNTAGKSTVGIEVPNLKKEKVRLKELMAVGGERVRNEMALPMYLGKDASGNMLIQDLATMPHMLIAGTTGSGKSVCMNSIIMSFLFTRRPDELKLILVDPKMVEMNLFKEVPHLMCPVVTDMGKAAAILEWAVTKMDERYELLSEAAVRDIDAYNKLTREEQLDIFRPVDEAEQASIPRKLPRIVFIMDELADLMITNKEVENHIVRIAQKARAVGIHLILATQRPQANVVTGLIKSNMPCRVSFKVASGMDSRIVLDHKGAELLLGQGDMLFLSPRTSKLTRAQGTLVDDSEIRRAVRFLREVAEPSFEPQLVQLRSADAVDGEDTGERDPLFEDAVTIVLETQRGSVSLLQRRLAIGYSRASRLIEEMAQAGIIGTYKGSQAREVTMSLEEWEAMREQMAKDAAAQAQAAAQAPDDDAEDSTWLDASEADEPVPDEYDDEYQR